MYGSTKNNKIQALVWNISCKPKLYRALAVNPFTHETIQIIAERFPKESFDDIIKAIILAEQEGSYDRDFKLLNEARKEEELGRQTKETVEITRYLHKYYAQNINEFARISEDTAYGILIKTAFNTSDLLNIEQRYSQTQRKHIKLLIFSLIRLAAYEKLPHKHQFILPKYGKTFVSAAFAVSLCILLFYCFQTIPATKRSEAKTQILAAETQKENKGQPTRLIIPTINVDAVVQNVGIAHDGAMGVPDNTIDVGWFEHGVRPGEHGSAVIAGHFNGENNVAGVFANLNKLKEGDKFYVGDTNGMLTSFVVRASSTYDAGYADEVFSRNDGVYLNLITCDGVWDEEKKSYNKRLVVFAEIID